MSTNAGWVNEENWEKEAAKKEEEDEQRLQKS